MLGILKQMFIGGQIMWFRCPLNSHLPWPLKGQRVVLPHYLRELGKAD